MSHTNTVQLSDQMHCKDCEQTWDMNDPCPPNCQPIKLICKCKGWRECQACRIGRRDGLRVCDTSAEYDRYVADWMKRKGKA